MTATAGPAPPVALTLAAQADVIFEAPLAWTDDAGTLVDLTAHTARLRFTGTLGSWETAPADVVDTTTNPATVGRITLAATSPNMTITIPAVVMEAAVFRRRHYVLEVTDPAGVRRRWAEGDMTLDRAEV